MNSPLQDGKEVSRYCPRCNTRLTIRTIKKSGRQWLRCENGQVACNYKEKIPESLYMLEMGARTLFPLTDFDERATV